MIFSYNNKSIHYQISGKGPAVLLLHGFLENGGMWKEMLPLLSKKATVLVPDLPGHGKSDVYGETHSMEFMAEVVHELLKHHKIGNVSLVGHSMGGYVALAFMEQYPDMVRQVIMLNSTTFADSEERRMNRDRAIELIKKNKSLFIPVAIQNLFAEDTRDQFTAEIRQLIDEANQIPVDGILAAIRGMRDRKDRSHILKAFDGSKLILAGKKDLIIPLSDSKQAAIETGTTLIEVDSGHMTLVENVKEISRIVHFIE